MRHPLIGSLLAVAVYLVLACLRFWPTVPWDPHTLPVCNCADYAKLTNFLAWTPWAIVHGHNPFYTTYQNFPVGVNMATNTTMPALGVLFAPISLTAGPIAAMNLLARLALASAAASAFFVLRRWVNWTPAAFFGGLLFGFSPYMSAHSNGHPNLIAIALLPVLLLLLDEILIRQRLRTRTAGLTLGVVAALQYGISSELLADAVVLAVVGVAALALWRRDLVRERVAYVVRAVAWSLVPFVLLAGYPIWMVLAGPEHLTGPIKSLASIDRARSDLLGAFLPTRAELISLGPIGALGSRFGVNLAEDATYVGLPLLGFLVGVTTVFRRDRRLVFASLAALACYVLSLGSTLNVDGHDTGFPLPYRILEHIPQLDGALAIRFFVFGYMFMALALALGLDHVASNRAPGRGGAYAAPDAGAGRDSRSGRWPRASWLAGCLGIAVLVPFIPRTLLPLREQLPHMRPIPSSYAVPAFFTSARALDGIPRGSPVLIYPYTTRLVNYSVLWQAVAGFRFKLQDSNATVRNRTGAGVGAGPPLYPPVLENVLRNAFQGTVRAKSNLPLAPWAVADVRLALARYDFSTVIAAPVGADPSRVVAVLTSALRRPPVRDDGAFVWYGVQDHLRGLLHLPGKT